MAIPDDRLTFELERAIALIGSVIHTEGKCEETKIIGQWPSPSLVIHQTCSLFHCYRFHYRIIYTAIGQNGLTFRGFRVRCTECKKRGRTLAATRPSSHAGGHLLIVRESRLS